MAEEAPTLADLMLADARVSCARGRAPAPAPLPSPAPAPSPARAAAAGAGLRRGFLLGGGSSSAGSCSVGSGVISAAGSALLLPAAAPLAAAAAPLRLPEVQAALAAGVAAGVAGAGAGGLGQALADRSWLTPALLERVAKEPRLAAALASPRLAAALADFQRDARAAAAAYAGDSEVLAFFRAFADVMGDHFTALGGGNADGGGGVGGVGGGGGSRGGAPPTPARARVQTPGDLSRAADAGERIGLTEAVDVEMQRVLANEELRALLADTKLQQLLRACAASPAALRAAMAQPDVRCKIELLRAHGLVRFQ